MTSRSPTTTHGGHVGGSPRTLERLNDSDIERVLEVVGARYIPPDLNRKQLVYDVNSAWNFYRNYRKETSKGRRTALLKYTKQVIAAANVLSELLDQPHEVADDFRKFVSQATFPLSDLQTRLQHLPRLARRLHDSYDVQMPIQPAYGLTATDFFLARDLARIFKKHFKREPGRSRSPTGGSPHGPFIRFAEAVGGALGQSATAETISKALTMSSLRSLRRRR
jgi:hypothetical protein